MAPSLNSSKTTGRFLHKLGFCAPYLASARWSSPLLRGKLPELGRLDRRRNASLAGLAPHARESGTRRGTRRIWGAHRKVREALYIAALTAPRRIPNLVAMRERMRQKGKAPKTILIAVARQIYRRADKDNRIATLPDEKKIEDEVEQLRTDAAFELAAAEQPRGSKPPSVPRAVLDGRFIIPLSFGDERPAVHYSQILRRPLPSRPAPS
ncbi:hypothetical protein DLJ53_03180 [Acuticoccus sediminis]|uniref:Transposase IS116/IS110/IS902 C-terminal domain-containing protein n=1 Tax=Acuticoccus sediminis TaxID=2184697 RepID=A0A8B2NWH0_9HYPH|nr:hypothetical protein DLJ53_03180 [Acuticoccus sediminis]